MIPRHLEIARQEVGLKEDLSPNQDKAGRIIQYNEAVRDSRYEMNAGDAYCAAFISWCCEQAGYPLTHRYGTGLSYVPWLCEYLEENDQWIEPNRVKEVSAGDLILFQFGDRPDHVGFVDQIFHGSLGTVEGNVGSFPNGGVKSMIRTLDSKVIGFGIVSPE